MLFKLSPVYTAALLSNQYRWCFEQIQCTHKDSLIGGLFNSDKIQKMPWVAHYPVQAFYDRLFHLSVSLTALRLLRHLHYVTELFYSQLPYQSAVGFLCFRICSITILANCGYFINKKSKSLWYLIAHHVDAAAWLIAARESPINTGSFTSLTVASA